ncbi:probable leucine--tRNA ligase, mitochondrial [Aricia agestis]|uniref:probable leucine--tRNA ligase, mitochondrial n=1 Tax=Aricia agestis TaxID=91739 RepID=UPI001C205398|nr:probable leucine--tRNA ligase, mitochondrial [Aricia agestis]
MTSLCKSAFDPLKATVFYRCIRHKSSLGLWHENINTDIKHKIEKHWAKDVTWKTKRAGKPVYVLPMFPYPSGNLHMGHVRVYSISDTIARFNKLNGNEVIHPIGWDAFGLPAENAAIERNILPHSWTVSNISTMKEQLLQLGFDFDWDREFSTCDPKYYKWTQYIFLKLFEKGLAYQSRAKVNWDPVDKTVLADEQVDDNGCSWRSGAKVEKKTLTQWYIKTTRYAKCLYDGLDNSELENWRDIINLQRHWIGECDGVVVDMHLKYGKTSKVINVWSADAYKFIHGEFLVIRPDNVMLDEISKEDSLKCYNPITGVEIPVYISDKIIYPEGRETYIACPSVDTKDVKISECLNIPMKEITNINIESENKRAIETAINKDCGGYPVSSKLKDWLISRQRCWGTPIPIIHCPNCGTVPVPVDDLPVELPNQSLSDSKSLTLSNFETWTNCKCPKCLGDAKRETDTMDTFVDSSWYFYRFLDPFNEKLPFDYNKLVGYVPVTCYIGGKEHAVLHLYYARFMSYFLNSIGLSPTKEPFKKLIVQGMVMGQSYKTKSSGKYLPPDQVEKHGKVYKQKGTGEVVIAQWEKMSKSKHNGENPQRLIETYGCDTTRLLILADVPPATSRKWSDATLPGVINWQHRLWLTVREFLEHRNNVKLYESSNLSEEKFKEFELSLGNSKNYFTATATYHFKYTHQLSVGISRLQSLTSALRNKIPADVIAKSKEYEMALAALIIMLSPVTPHFCSELWAGFTSAPHKLGDSFIDWNTGVLEQRWPTVDSNYPLSFQCKVDGADRCELKIEASKLPHLTEEKALQAMLQEESVQKTLRHGILRTKYELYPDCRAILHIYTNRSTATKAKKDEQLEQAKA